MDYYTLDDENNVVPMADDVLEWAYEQEHLRRTGRRIVAQEQIGPYFVSTVFLGLNHRFGDGPPLIFETMVFKRPADPDKLGEDLYCDRYSTWMQAVAGHDYAVGLARKGMPNE